MRVLALYNKGEPDIALSLNLLLKLCSERRLTIVLYSLLVVEGIVKAAMVIFVLLQYKGKCEIDYSFLCLVLLGSGHWGACFKRNDL